MTHCDGPTNGQVLRIAVPMTLAYVSTPLMGIVDTIVIGRLGEAHLIGGIAIGSVLLSVIFTTFNFLRSGTTGITAQALGAGDAGEVRAGLVRALLIAVACGLVMAALAAPLGALGAASMGGSAQVNATMTEYFNIRVIAAPLTLANYALLGWFLGLGRAGVGLALQVVLNGLNMVLSAWLVLGLGWGVAGVAWGSVVAEAAALGLGVVLVLSRGNLLRGAAPIFNSARFARLFVLNRDIMIRSMALLLVFAFFTAQGARQGDTVLAANAVLMHFFYLGGYLLDGFAMAAEQLVGHAIGARRREIVVRAVRLTALWCLVLGALLSGLLIAFGPVFIDLMTVNAQVREVARDYLVWAALTPIVGAMAFEFDGVFIGATWSADMRNMMLFAVAVAGLVWWVAMPAMGNNGLWLALHVFLACRGASLMMRYPKRLATTFAT
ncbi:MAG: MATE family efflux transporter [Alphaproteobacteria bacterium]